MPVGFDSIQLQVVLKSSFSFGSPQLFLSFSLKLNTQCNNTYEEGAIAETSTGQDPEESPYKRFKYLSTVLSERLKEQGKSLTQTTQQSPEQEELEKYSNEPVAKENQDPLEFWVCNQSKYPHLAPVAFDLLVIPASSAPVERVFSTAGIITSGRRIKSSWRQAP